MDGGKAGRREAESPREGGCRKAPPPSLRSSCSAFDAFRAQDGLAGGRAGQRETGFGAGNGGHAREGEGGKCERGGEWEESKSGRGEDTGRASRKDRESEKEGRDGWRARKRERTE